MIKYTNECCDCAVAGYPCLGTRCPNRSVPHYYCDICGDELVETEIAYRDDDYIECINCHEEEEQPDKED